MSDTDTLQLGDFDRSSGEPSNGPSTESMDEDVPNDSTRRIGIGRGNCVATVERGVQPVENGTNMPKRA